MVFLKKKIIEVGVKSFRKAHFLQLRENTCELFDFEELVYLYYSVNSFLDNLTRTLR